MAEVKGTEGQCLCVTLQTTPPTCVLPFGLLDLVGGAEKPGSPLSSGYMTIEESLIACLEEETGILQVDSAAALMLQTDPQAASESHTKRGRAVDVGHVSTLYCSLWGRSDWGNFDSRPKSWASNYGKLSHKNQLPSLLPLFSFYSLLPSPSHTYQYLLWKRPYHYYGSPMIASDHFWND